MFHPMESRSFEGLSVEAAFFLIIIGTKNIIPYTLHSRALRVSLLSIGKLPKDKKFSPTRSYLTKGTTQWQNTQRIML
jgi:hypothetical protein